MSSKKIIQFIYAKGNNEIKNRQSALGSYLNCLCDILEQNNFEIYFNDLKFSEIVAQPSVSNALSNPVGKGKWHYVPAFIKNFIKDLQKFRQVKNLKSKIEAANIQPDLIIEVYNYGSDLGLYFSENKNVPFILIYDAPVLEEYEFFYGKKFFFRRKIQKREKNTLSQAKNVIIYSNAVKQYLLRNYPILSATTFSIHQNVDFTRFDFIEPRTSANEINLCFIGSFLKWHRVDLLLDVFEDLYKSNDQLKLFLVGSGVELKEVQERIKGMQSKKAITLTGFLDGEQLKNIKLKSHIGIMPGSNWYGAPNKIFEYGAAGMAVVAPDTPTIKDLFTDKIELLLFKWDDKEDLKNKLASMIEDKSLYISLAGNLQKYIREKYSEERTLEFYTKIINDSIQNNLQSFIKI